MNKPVDKVMLAHACSIKYNGQTACVEMEKWPFMTCVVVLLSGQLTREIYE
jgi:hypothetical protein